MQNHNESLFSSWLKNLCSYSPCLSCGRLYSSKIHLCQICKKQIFADLNIFCKNIGEYRVYSFFKTNKPKLKFNADRHFIEKLILQLKSCGDSEKFNFFAEICDQQAEVRSLLMEQGKPILIYPPSPRLENHAKAYAGALASRFGLELQQAFKSISKTGGIKHTSLKERKGFKLILDEKFTYQKDRQYILIDDLVTSGSTIQACYIALNRPKNFCAITLASRQAESPEFH